MISTRRMAATAPLIRQIQIDMTYKLNWSGKPVIVIGGCDKQRRFYPLSLHVFWSTETKEVQWNLSIVGTQGTGR